MIRKEDLFRAMKLPAAADRLLRTVVPSDMDPDVGTTGVGFDPLDPGNVGRVGWIGGSHQDAVTS